MTGLVKTDRIVKSILLLNVIATLKYCPDTFKDGFLPTLSSHEESQRSLWGTWGGINKVAWG